MARRSGFERFLLAAAKEASRQVRLSEQQSRRAEREAAALARATAREAAAELRQRSLSLKEAEKERKAAYLATREAEVTDLNSDLEERETALDGLLEHTLVIYDAIDFDALRLQEPEPQSPRMQQLSIANQQPDFKAFFAGIAKPTGFIGRLPWVKRGFERKVERAKQLAYRKLDEWKGLEAKRKSELATARAELDSVLQAFNERKAARDAEVDAFRGDYQAGDPEALVAYFSMVLERSVYPDSFPQTFSVAFQADSKMVVLDYELPPPSVVPSVAEYRYVKVKDSIDERPRKPAEIKARYADVVASIALRTLHEIFESDVAGHAVAVCFNGMVDSVDPATGRDIRPCLVSVRATREQFEQIDLSRVDKAACLRNLGAQVSRNPEEVVPVKPIVEFRMTDARFVDQNDLVSGLDSATNLMELTPTQFEEVVANLFGKMGLESKLTRASRDGGVDCVAFDPRPVLGGKVVIQAKRYRHTVGVSAVRDLYGTMMNEGASKGLLVTTSGYGPDAFEFSKDKPIELIDGGGLLFLLNDIGVTARIVMPKE